MSIRLKFYLAFSLIAALAIALGGYGMRSISMNNGLTVRLYDEPLIGVSYARAASATLNEARGLMERRLSLDSNGLPEAVASLDRMRTDIAEDLRIVRQRLHDTMILGVLGQTDTLITAWFSSGRTILAPPPGGVTALPLRSVVTRKGVVAAASLDDLVELVTALGFSYRGRVIEQMDTTNATLGVLTGGIFVLSALFALLFAQSMLRPIRMATRIAEEIAVGNAVQLNPTTRCDEIGRLLNCLAAMQSSLRSRAAQATTLSEEKDRTAETLRQINLRFDTALENISQGLTFFDAGQRLIVCNRRFGELYGLSPDQTQVGTLLSDILHNRIISGSFPEMTLSEYLEQSNTLSVAQQPYDIIDKLRDGRIISMHHEPLPGGSWVATHEDITERRNAEASVIFMARHDALTQLPNRVTFQERLEQAMDMVSRGLGCAVLYLDLDHFKPVNDTFGHPVGDALLQAAADRLRSCVRETDTVARLGGDEFAIIQLLMHRPEDARQLASRITERFCDPFEIDGHLLTIGISIGIAMAPGDGTVPEQLLHSADIALYVAKKEARGTARFFEPAMDLRIQKRRMMEMDLQGAIARSEFEIYYQPVVNLAAGAVSGFEALLRWHHPIHGIVSPAEFIPVAEETGLIVEIGEWVLRTACFEAENWPADIRVAVNLSPVQFKKGDLVAAVTEALKASGLRPDRLELEITEMVELQSTAGTLAALHSLRAMGITVALDDFGTGYSSLSYLRAFPFDRIKIDQSFVRDMMNNKESISIIRAIIGLGDSLGMKTTAEGVETHEQLEILRAEGCVYIQGYFFSRPKPASEIPSLIKSLLQVRADSNPSRPPVTI